MTVVRPARTAGALLMSLLLAVGFLTGSVPAAVAAVSETPPVVANPNNAVTGDALPTAQINGVAWDQVVVGNTVYVAGQFTSARPAGAAPGTNESPRANLMSYNLRTGVMTSWAPQVDGRIRVITASPDGSRLYIGGSFSTVNGQPRSRVAAFNTSDGSLVSSFAPRAGSDVFGITASNTAVYMGGWFTTMNNVPRTRLAAVSASNGALLNWAPTADFTVYGLGLTTAQDRVVVSGSFSTLNGEPATSLGSLDAVTGTSYPFAANQVVHNIGNTASMMALKVVDNKAYSSGYWYGGTGNFEGGLIMDPYNGSILNMANCLGDTYDIAPMNGLYYMVSHHHQCSDSGGFPEATPRIWQHTDAFTIEPSGLVQPNTYGYPNFAGHPAGSPVNWYPTMSIGKASGSDQAGWSVEAQGDYLVIGGEFTKVNGTDQQGLVRFGTRNVVTAPKMGPSAHISQTTPRLDALSATSTRVRFQADVDRDSRTLTYKVVRNDLGEGAPVFTTTSDSTFWDRPWFQFTDTGLVPGRAYAYRVIATDSDGNTRTGQAAITTAGADVPDPSSYATQVAADGALHYWRLREAAGSTYSVDHGPGSSDLNLRAGVTLRRPGAINGSTDTAASFNGADTGFAVSSTPENAPDTFSAEAWFRTTTTRGGKLVGFGNATSGNSGNYDRHVYMNDAGNITFGVHPGGVRAMTSAKAYNDGAWHHVVATLSPAGMTLHVDGLRVGADAATTSGQPFTGYWRVGGDSQGGWPNGGSSDYFAGDLDDVAIYPTALTQAQIRDHYTRSGRTVDVPAPPADAYGRAVTADEPLFFWRLDETTATAADATGNGGDGTYRNGPTQGVASPVTTLGKAAGFDGGDDFVSSNSSYVNPTVFTAEAWFNTTSTQGGKVIGFGRSQDGNSSSYDRHVYLDPAGRVNFGTYTGQSNIARSARPFNDGQWHHVVATLGANGLALYVDGVLQGTNPTTGAENYTGYWRVGGDSTWAGNPYLQGSIDEVAVYPTVLDAAAVRAHYQASPAARNAAPVVAIDGTCAGMSCALTANATDPDGTVTGLVWDFGDGTTATGTTVSHTYANEGTYTVTLTATDNAGDTATATRTVDARRPLAAPTDAYGTRIMADDPLLYWRLGETSGDVANDHSRYVHPGSYADGVALGQPGGPAPVDPSARFDGEARATSQDRFVNPTSFAIEAWFNTTSTGGRIIGFGNASSGRSGNYDRHVYLDGSGRAVFGVWAPGGQTITSPTALNDGRWHHVVASMDGSGMALYVDGSLVGTNPNSSVDSYDGHWRVGADNVWDGSGSFNGLIDEAAVYGAPLSAATVRDHYRASATYANAAPAPAFTVARTGLSVAVDGTPSTDDSAVATHAWNFGDGSTATQGTATHTYAAPGTYTVTLTVTDDQGATASTAQQVTVRAPLPAPTDHYATEVLSDAPTLYWRLDDASGTTALDQTGGTHDGTYVGDVTRQVPSPLASGNSAAGFGPDEVVSSVDRFSNPTVFSVEAWFKTAGTGGRILGFSNEQSGRSSGYDRHIFVDESGHVGFGTWTGFANTVVSPQTYNDDAWHHVVATLGPTGRVLYVDGVAVGSNTDPNAQPFDGYWRAGTDNIWNGSGAFDGVLDEVAVYPNVLTADRVAAHHAASSSVNTPPVASFTAASDGLTLSVDATASSDDTAVAGYAWDFGDGASATGVTATHAYAAAGTYTVRLTVTDNEGVTGTTTNTVVVTAPNVPPTASFTHVVNDQQVTFDGNGSTDPDGTIATWSWNFGDGTTGEGVSPVHAYAAPGTYAVTLTVTDGAGATASVTQQVVAVAPNQAPTAAFTARADGLAVALDGGASTDEGSIASWAWSFGDGSGGTGRTVSHSYTEGGTYPVTLTVTDDRGASASTTQQVTVTAPPQVTAIAKDGFGRTGTAWGNAEVGGAWTVSGTGFSTDGNRGVVSINAAGATRTAELRSVSARDVVITGDLAYGRSPNGFIQQVWARSTTTNDRYTMQVRWDASGTARLLLARSVGNVETVLRTVTLTGMTYNTGDVWRYRFEVRGSAPATLEAKVWNATQPEPAAPLATATDTTAALAGPGAVGLRFYTGSGTTPLPLVANVDNLVVTAPGAPPANQAPVASFQAAPSGLRVAVDGSASTDPDGSIASHAWSFGDGATATGATASHTYAAAGTYTVTLVVTDDAGATATTTRSVTVTAPPAGLLALDEFNRTGSGWGTADVGGAWNLTPVSGFSTDGSSAIATIPTAGVTRIARLEGLSARDVSVVTDLTLDKAPAGGTYQHQVRARIAGDNVYTFTLRFLSTGALNLQLVRTVGGVETIIRSTTINDFAYRAGEKINVRFDVVGNGTTTLNGTVWRGAAEPAVPSITVTDTTAALQAPGAVGLRFYTGGGMTSIPLKVSTDRLAVEAR